MECLGRAGYVEDWPMARLFRQSPLNAIWEGSGNVIALDLLRALQREPEAREALLGELRDAAAGESSLAAAADESEALLAAPVAEGAARHVVERLALMLAAATLARHGGGAALGGFVTRRLSGRSLTLGAGEGAIDEAALLERLAIQA